MSPGSLLEICLPRFVNTLVIDCKNLCR